MPDQLAQAVIARIARFPSRQLRWFDRVADALDQPARIVLNPNNLLTQEGADDLADVLRIHHSFSAESFTKDKFEHALCNVLQRLDRSAALAPRGNRGHDLTVDGQRISLKTQADSGVKSHEIWISKFMELGKGKWGSDPEDLVGLRQSFLHHMEQYDRILTLRTLSKAPTCRYELIEIPKALLQTAATGRLQMMSESRQDPKPGYCYVSDSMGVPVFQLYFDGGGERKLQIKQLQKSACTVIADWQFQVTIR